MNIIGHVEGKNDVVLIDDRINMAGTITLAANAFKTSGAKKCLCFMYYPVVLSGPLCTRVEDSAIEHLVVTDSIFLPEDRKSEKIDGNQC